MSISKEQAEQLWGELAGGFATIESVIPRIIAEKAWEPLGYTTFAEAWADRLKGHRLATSEPMARVLYALMDDGASDMQMIELIGTQLSPEVAARVRVQHDAGVPPEYASVRAHARKLPGRPRFVRVELREEEYEDLRVLLDRRNETVERWASKILMTEYEKLRRAGRRRSVGFD